MRTLRMEKDYHTRIRRGHRWAWRGDFDPAALAGVAPGEAVRLESGAGEFLGVGYANPLSHIAVRMVDFDDREPDAALVRRRLEAALAWRERVRPGAAVARLVFGESDGLPGLVADRYGSVLVISQSVAGMERWTGLVAEELSACLGTDTVILRNTNLLRRLEGLEVETRLLAGRWDGPVTVDHDGVRVVVDCWAGRKTGLFLDHRENRRLLSQLVHAGEFVLDLFSYSGLWAHTLLAAGAGRAVCVDSDPAALEMARASAAANGWANRLEAVTQNVEEFLAAETRRFDVVVLDPPAFAKKKRFLDDALAIYRRHNALALARVAPGGVLATASCSSFTTREMLLREVIAAAAEAGRDVQLVAEGCQALDHPVLPAMPETHYLKCMFFRVMSW
ncbi:MAG TPA: class I SAM-dependent rRNA methyltransferase [Acidobacteriota bacterium]|nr:class I SAM-dependent rRNA methyltransferase [Acidobacteriota bacterium]HQG91102.1 class I SAM-dependent rRNA methyltransferase [Acidobacteriota bacterium]